MYRAVALPRMASPAAQVTPADRCVEVQADSLMSLFKENTQKKGRKVYAWTGFAQNAT